MVIYDFDMLSSTTFRGLCGTSRKQLFPGCPATSRVLMGFRDYFIVSTLRTVSRSPWTYSSWHDLGGLAVGLSLPYCGLSSLCVTCRASKGLVSSTFCFPAGLRPAARAVSCPVASCSSPPHPWTGAAHRREQLGSSGLSKCPPASGSTVPASPPHLASKGHPL